MILSRCYYKSSSNTTLTKIILNNFCRRNLTAGAIFSYEGLPDSLKTEVLVRTKVEEDPEVLRERQEIVMVRTNFFDSILMFDIFIRYNSVLMSPVSPIFHIVSTFTVDLKHVLNVSIHSRSKISMVFTSPDFIFQTTTHTRVK